MIYLEILLFDKEQRDQLGVINTLADFIPRKGDLLVIDDLGINITKLRDKVFKVFQVEYPIVLTKKTNETNRFFGYEAMISSKERSITVSIFEYR